MRLQSLVALHILRVSLRESGRAARMSRPLAQGVQVGAPSFQGAAATWAHKVGSCFPPLSRMV